MMTDNWDFYALRVNDEPASIFVDLGIEADAPLRSHPCMAYIRLYMNSPRTDGLSSSEEFDKLMEIERHIEANLCSDVVGYVGRNTSGGCRDFYFYISAAGEWQFCVDQALLAFPGYRYETGARMDPEWSSYLDFLRPSAIDRQRIENRRVCEALEQHGDNLALSREIDHWSYFPSPEAVDDYVAEVAKAGFLIRNRSVGDEGSLRFGVQVWKTDTPSYGRIDDITLPLFEASIRSGGDYDGWECSVEA